MTDDRPTALYRMRDKNGRLLYVGISFTAMKRIEDHKAKRGWWFNDVTRIDVEWFPTRGRAEDAERTAIQTEKPKWNVAHAYVKRSPLDTPPKRRPAADVLDEVETVTGVTIDDMRQAVDGIAVSIGWEATA